MGVVREKYEYCVILGGCVVGGWFDEVFAYLLWFCGVSEVVVVSGYVL